MTTSSSTRITKQSGSNLALAFFCLPKKMRRDMASFYAFCRIVDDVVDENADDLERARDGHSFWRKKIEVCYSGGAPVTELGKELADIARRHQIPQRFFHDILDGVEMDLEKKRYATFAELEKYCYGVASAVGLVSIHIFGCTHPQSEEYAVALGKAFQLTNILRDVRHDLEEFGRIYLPQDEMAACGVTEEDLRRGGHSPALEKLFRLQYFRARHFYSKAQRLIHPQDREALKAAFVMTRVYRSLLEKIRRNQFRVLEQNVRLTKKEKLKAIFQAWFCEKKEKLRRPLRVAVWGGGYAGLSAALHAALSGHSVELYEAKPRLGGRAHSFKETHTGAVLDNSPHVFMGCYRASMRLFEMLGVKEKLHLSQGLSLRFCSEAQGLTTLQIPAWPWPFYGLAALVRFKELNWRDRLSILRMGGRLALGLKPGRNQTAEEWLKHQTRGAVRALWEPLCVAALNEPISTASARVFYEVIRRALFSSRADSAVYFTKTSLDDFFVPEARLFLESVGARVHENCAVQAVHFRKNEVESFQTTDGREVKADVYISALPWRALAALLPEGNSLKHSAESISSSPIVTVYLWTDRPLFDAPMLGLLDSPVHWVLDQTARSDGKNYLYAAVMSGAYEHVHRGNKEMIERVWNELCRLLPSAREAKVTHGFVYKALDATFASTPETEAHRPANKTAWENLFLAGDWTATGLPGTLESAVVSGKMVMEKIENKDCKK
ncbi:MAG: hydroxysqualene dehydroxylase HpnE [bacterium]